MGPPRALLGFPWVLVGRSCGLGPGGPPWRFWAPVGTCGLALVGPLGPHGRGPNGPSSAFPRRGSFPCPARCLPIEPLGQAPFYTLDIHIHLAVCGSPKISNYFLGEPSCVTQQTRLLCDATDMSAVRHSRHVCYVTEGTQGVPQTILSFVLPEWIFGRPGPPKGERCFP